jgi:hypothetical protein
MDQASHPLARDLARRDAVEALLRRIDRRIDDGVRAYSFERGYCVPLRREAVRRELQGGRHG